jgi:adenylate cyclase
LGQNLTTLDASHNEITQLSLVPGPIGRGPYTLVSLDISHAKLSTLDGLALAQLSSLQTLRLDHNSFRFIPESLGDLSWLETLSCSDNQLDALPASIGRLQKLETLDAHNNSLTEVPVSLWNCASLSKINVTSNLLGIWHDPPPVTMTAADIALSVRGMQPLQERKPSATSIGGRPLPPLAHSLEKLYLGENRFTDEVLHPLTILRELRVLNLSFNEIQEMPPTFFQNLTKLEELYMSGNKLTSIPTEDLPRLTRLSVLFLNGNRLQTLPQELGKVQSLTVLDVGSNLLKYNINNWEFDWNW